MTPLVGMGGILSVLGREWESFMIFSPTRLSGPSWFSSRDVRVFVSLFVPFPCNFFCVVGLVQSVPRPWTGAILILILSRALKTRMCPEFDLDLE